MCLIRYRRKSPPKYPRANTYQRLRLVFPVHSSKFLMIRQTWGMTMRLVDMLMEVSGSNMRSIRLPG